MTQAFFGDLFGLGFAFGHPEKELSGLPEMLRSARFDAASTFLNETANVTIRVDEARARTSMVQLRVR